MVLFLYSHRRRFRTFLALTLIVSCGSIAIDKLQSSLPKSLIGHRYPLRTVVGILMATCPSITSDQNRVAALILEHQNLIKGHTFGSVSSEATDLLIYASKEMVRLGANYDQLWSMYRILVEKPHVGESIDQESDRTTASFCILINMFSKNSTTVPDQHTSIIKQNLMTIPLYILKNKTIRDTRDQLLKMFNH